MAAAVGRGRSRGIRSTRPPGVASPINSQSPAPSPPLPPAATVAPPVNPFVTEPTPAAATNPPHTTTPQDIATSCLNLLRNPKRRNQSDCYRDCIEVLSKCLGAPENSKFWVEKCIQEVRGDILLSQEFVQLVATVQADQSIPNSKELVSATLRAMNQEMTRLLPENPSAMSEVQGEEYASFTVLLAEVALHVTRFDGQPIKSLTSVVFKDCLHVLAQPGFPDQVYSSLHHVLKRYGKTLEDYLHSVAAGKNIPPQETAREIENLYDKIRGIIIHDSTSDKSRLLMLEAVERRAYQYNIPEECLQYYRAA
ncbi:hypothetical protein ACHWQZ_G011579 [Mnemiopsis leidyi]